MPAVASSSRGGSQPVSIERAPLKSADAEHNKRMRGEVGPPFCPTAIFCKRETRTHIAISVGRTTPCQRMQSITSGCGGGSVRVFAPQ